MPYHPFDDPPNLPHTAYTLAALPAPPTVPLDGHLQADIAIVGAGYTGLSAAVHAAEAGARVVVLEANAIGWGASGRNFGQVVPYLRHGSARAIKVFGADFGQRMIDAAAAGPDLVFELIARHAIDCQATRTGLIFAAHTPAAFSGLAERSAQWQRRGAPVELLGPRETGKLIGGGRYWGSSLDRRGGTINALSFARGMAAGAIRHGAQIHTASRVIALRRNGMRWDLATPAGTVTSEVVLLCAGAYTDDLWPGLRASLLPLRSYAVVSRPISENLRETILPGRQALTETRRLHSGIRVHPDGRIHMSAEGPHLGPEGTPDTAALSRRLLRIFPQLDHIEWDGHWSGWIDLTPSQFPELHELAPGLLSGLGYSGRGIALATAMGRELARHALGASANDLAFAITRPKSVPFARFAQPMLRALVGLARIRDAFDDARYGAGPKPPSPPQS